MANKINGMDVNEEIRYCNNCSNLGLDFKTGKFYCGLSNRPDELPEVLSCDEFNPNCYIKRLQEENEKIKKQYNCYACGNCGGKEDYINLKKHHKGLRKQFDELVKRNNTLSLRIEELEKENENLKAENKYYAKLMLEQQDISQKYWECIEKIKQVIEVLAETCNVYPLKTNLDILVTTINEVLNNETTR